jgi:hypothetical protein
LLYTCNIDKILIGNMPAIIFTYCKLDKTEYNNFSLMSFHTLKSLRRQFTRCPNFWVYAGAALDLHVVKRLMKRVNTRDSETVMDILQIS